MKKLLSVIFVISGLFVNAQVPQGINYQSIIRNTSGVVLPSTAVTVEFKLYTSPTFTLPSVLLYDETHSATTNSFGMVNLVIGQGTAVGGLVTFNNIPWIVAGVHYEVWVNSSQVGTRQPFMSVPYAMNALTAAWAPSPTLSVTGNTLSVGSNTVTIPTGPTYTAGTGIAISGNTITNTSPDQTVSLTGLGSATVTGTYPNFSIETPTVAAAATPTITGTGTGVATVTTSATNFTVDVPAPNYNASTGVLAMGSQSITVVPTLALSGTTLTSGASTNSVDLATLPGLWSAPTSSTVVTTNSLSLVGIGTPTPGYKLDAYATGSVPATIHGYNSGATASASGVFGEHPGLGIGVYGQSVTGKGIWGSATTSGVGVYGESVSGDAGKFILSSNTNTSNAVNAQTNGTGAALYARSFNAVPLAARFDGNLKVTGNSTLDSSWMMSAYSFTPGLSTLGQGRIYYNGALNKFMVSENNGPYKPLFGASPWTQGPGFVSLTNMNDMVGIGTAAPNAALEVVVSNPAADGIQVNINDVTNGGNAVQVNHNGNGNAGYFQINNQSSSSSGIVAFSNAPASTIKATNTNTTSAGAHAILASAVSGAAISASNSSSVAATMILNQGGIGDAAQIVATQGRAIYAASNGTSGYSTAEFANNGSTSAIYAYKNTGATAGSVAGFSNNEPANASDAVQVFNSGTGSGISVSNTNSSPTSYAGVFTGGITTKGKSNTSSDYAFRAFNSASTSLLSVRNDAIVEIGANVGINILNPANRLHVNSSYANAAALIENITSVSTASVAHGVLAKASSTHSLAAAVFANNLGTGPSVYGMKTASDNGIAGRFELLNTSNTADAVFALSSGSGAAVHATTGSTAGSALALWVEGGHIKSTQATLTGSDNGFGIRWRCK